MNRHSLPRLSRALRLGLLVAAVLGLVTGLFAWRQVESERAIDLEDVTRRAHVLAQQLSSRVVAALSGPESAAGEALQSQLESYRRLLGYAVFDVDGRLLAAGKTVAEFSDKLEGPVREAVRSGTEVTELTLVSGMRVHVFAQPLPGESRVMGVLVVVHDLSDLDDRAVARIAQYTFWVLIITLMAVILVVGSTWIAYERPLRKLADWMQRLRLENVTESPPREVPSRQLHSESDRLAASFRAARYAGRARSEAALHAEQVWTSERLRTHALPSLGEAHQLIVVSNREPYMHQWRDGNPHAIVPAGGLVTALDPVLQACGGVWIAHGAGDADRETADAHGRLTVPPGDARYTLKRVWLSREEEEGYYYGFSNEGLWPLCHLAHTRPEFRSKDWTQYCHANQRFADAVLEELGVGQAVVLVQDYQLALVPRMLREARPELRIGFFWHIPWPSMQVFRICPWDSEILDGMLGADLVGFHLQQYCNNFLDTVDRVIESRLNWDNFTVELRAQRSLVRPFPISVQPWSERHVHLGEDLARQIIELKAQHQLRDTYIAVGVDRIDYTKGLHERFRAIARFLEKYPQYRRRFTFVELGAPSRTHILQYRQYLDELEALAHEINWKYQTDSWKPIHLLIAHHEPRTVHAFLCMAPMCIVSSLDDGMNLVAKEYAAAQTGGEGVLILSEFAGAACELTDALIVNPYNIEQFAETIRSGVEMDASERRMRMQRLFRQVEEHNIYWWAAGFLTELASARTTGAKTAFGSKTVARS